VYGLQAKGLNGNEPPHTSVEQMAAYYIKEIRTVQPQGPYYLAGYCFGGVLAFEMAQQLGNEGEEIALLASLNGLAPGYNDPLPAGDADKPASEINLLPTRQRWDYFRLLSSKEKLIYALKVLKSKVWSYGTQARVRRWAYTYYLLRNRPLPEAFGKHYFLEMNSVFVKAYQPKPYRGTMVVFHSPSIYHDPYLGWTPLAKEGIQTHAIAGNHLTRRQIMQEPFVELTAEKLKEYLPH
jgi:thioesterase domain-containing protein